MDRLRLARIPLNVPPRSPPLIPPVIVQSAIRHPPYSLCKLEAMEEREQRERMRSLLETRPSARPPDFVNPLEKIEQLLTCPICLDRYKCPKLLPCQHTFCLPCLESCAESAGRALKCPECRAEHNVPYDGVKAFQTNYTLTGFLDIHLQATSDSSAQIEEYIHRYNLERCKCCDEKAECENCAHCEKRACKDCRTQHMDLVKRDVGRLLNSVKRLSNRIIEASDSVQKGMELMNLNCETTKTEVKEYFHRYQRELKKKEDGLIFEIDQFNNNESRLMSNLRDVLELESSNMNEGVSRLEAAVKGECVIEDADLIKYMNVFKEGLEYLRNFQPDADELFCKKLRFAPGEDASKLPSAIASFGELTVLVPQFAGRYLPLESSYLPRAIRLGLESESYRGSRAKELVDEEVSSRRHVGGRYGRTASGLDDLESLRFRRKRELEDEVWNRLNGSPLATSTPGASPWSRSPLPETHPAPEPAAITPVRQPTRPPPLPTLAPSTSNIPKPATNAAASTSHIPRSSSPSTAHRRNSSKPPLLPRQRSSADDSSLNEKIETIRRAHEKRTTGSALPPPLPLSASSVESSAANTAESSEAESPAEDSAPSPATGRSRIRIICRASSVSREEPRATPVGGTTPTPPTPSPTLPALTTLNTDTLTTPSSTDEEPPPSPIPIQHYPGDGSGSSTPTSSFFPSSVDRLLSTSLIDDSTPPTTPAWLARRRARFARSKTNPDLAAAFGIASASPRVQQLLEQRRHSRLDSSTDVRVGAAPEGDGAAAPPPRGRHSSVSREAAEYRKMPTRVFGRKGGKEGELNWPRGMAPMAGGLLAVADSSNHRICIFALADGRFVRSLGEYGTGTGQLDSCAGVAATRQRQLIVTDRYNHRVVVYDADGEVTTTWGGHGPQNGRFNNPWGIAVDDHGMVYVVDKDNHRVQMFDRSGNFLGRFGTIGHGDGQLNSPLFIALNRSTHEVYVTDSSNNRVCVFDSRGTFRFSFGDEGFHAGQFKLPRGIAIDHKGNVIVADSGNNRIQIFSPGGDFIATFGSWGAGAGQLKGVEAVSVLNDGSIVVSDRDNHRIQVFE